ncbi:nucleoside-diphosphate kinase [Candidatus Woesearchaeota archaeon]|nr:nucleoside-diphosphate kinase [Candidatus Woesearchaeota archaeon]
MIERTLVLIKPDGVQRGLVGRILSRFEDAGLKVVGMKLVLADENIAKKHYKDDLIPIVGGKTKKDWDAAGMKYSETVEELGVMIVNGTRKFLMSGPVVAMVLEGLHAVEIVRKIVGTTGPKDSPPGTIRGDFAHSSLGYASIKKKGAANLIHASGNVREAGPEIELWFKKDELHSYKTVHDLHTIYG